MTYTLILDLIYDVPLIAKEVDNGLHHLALARVVFDHYVSRLIQSQALADLVDPKLQPQVETAEGFLLKNAHGVLACVSTGYLLSSLVEVGVVYIEKVLAEHISTEAEPMAVFLIVLN